MINQDTFKAEATAIRSELYITSGLRLLLEQLRFDIREPLRPAHYLINYFMAVANLRDHEVQLRVCHALLRRVCTQRHAAKLKAATWTHVCRPMQWYIMTSPATDAPTQEYFKEKEFFGLQANQVHFFQQVPLRHPLPPIPQTLT